MPKTRKKPKAPTETVLAAAFHLLGDAEVLADQRFDKEVLNAIRRLRPSTPRRVEFVDEVLTLLRANGFVECRWDSGNYYRPSKMILGHYGHKLFCDLSENEKDVAEDLAAKFSEATIPNPIPYDNLVPNAWYLAVNSHLGLAAVPEVVLVTPPFVARAAAFSPSYAELKNKDFIFLKRIWPFKINKKLLSRHKRPLKKRNKAK